MLKAQKMGTLLVLAACLHACTWVPLTPEGEKVRVAQPGEVQNCERKGGLTSSLRSRVAGVERKPGKVAGELEALARNEAALMGGDTVVAESPIDDGRQSFGVYRCQR
ncbi:MAG: DUF4156 domain-containing protein [Xanthomonadales bacterium]|nr:DUF4156 domain-containing protein [Xanthomonadales bacterium]